VRRENKLPIALSRAEMRMIRQMCAVKLSDKIACGEVREVRIRKYCGCVAT